MGILYTIIIGFFVGVVAKLLTPGKDPGGCIVTTLLGIGGALLAKFLGQAIGWYEQGQAAGFVASVVGAALLLLLYRLFSKKSKSD